MIKLWIIMEYKMISMVEKKIKLSIFVKGNKDVIVMICYNGIMWMLSLLIGISILSIFLYHIYYY